MNMLKGLKVEISEIKKDKKSWKAHFLELNFNINKGFKPYL
jgi:hypothetical protein